MSFHGRYTDFAGIDAHPRPVQVGGPPIVVGGRSSAAHRRAIAWGQGWYGFMLDVEATEAQVAALRRAEADRPRPAGLERLEISVTPAGRMDADKVRAFAGAGVDRLILYPGALEPEATVSYLREHAGLIEIET